MQIDTNIISQADAPSLYQERMKQMASDYLNTRDQQRKINSMMTKQGNRFDIDIDDLRQSNPELANYVLKNPIESIGMFEGHIDRAAKDLRDGGAKDQSEKQAAQQSAADKAFPTKVKKYYVNFTGNMGRNHVTPRGLKSTLVNQFVSVQGIVTRMAVVKPKVQTSVHYCEATKKGLIKHYADDTNLAELGEGAVRQGTEGDTRFPDTDVNNNHMSAEYGFCVYKDSQILTIQEMPENAPPGLLPRSVQVILENDLVDKVKPGDRVEVNGVFRCKGAAKNGITNGVFQTHIVATGVNSLLAEKEKPHLSETDVRNIKNIGKRKDCFDLLGRSIAPTI